MIDAALLRGEPFRRVAAQHGVSATSLRRHAEKHMDTTREQVRAELAEQTAITTAGDLVPELAELRKEARAILVRTKDDRTALAAIREMRACLDSIREMMTRAAKVPDVVGQPVQIDSPSIEQFLAADPDGRLEGEILDRIEAGGSAAEPMGVLANIDEQDQQRRGGMT